MCSSLLVGMGGRIQEGLKGLQGAKKLGFPGSHLQFHVIALKLLNDDAETAVHCESDRLCCCLGLGLPLPRCRELGLSRA